MLVKGLSIVCQFAVARQVIDFSRALSPSPSHLDMVHGVCVCVHIIHSVKNEYFPLISGLMVMLGTQPFYSVRYLCVCVHVHCGIHVHVCVSIPTLLRVIRFDCNVGPR